MKEELTTKNLTRIETYDLRLGERSFTVKYIYNFMELREDVEPIDDNVILGETLYNKYETPRIGSTSVPEGVSKGHARKTEIFRTVMRDLYTGHNYVEIQQWREIPEGLESLIDDLPDHVRNLLRTEYSDLGVTPYDFGYPVED